MASCREIDALVTPFVDGEVSPDQRMMMQAHLAACPPCRERVDAEAAARDTLRRGCRCPNAPDNLRRRCSSAATPLGRLLASLKHLFVFLAIPIAVIVFAPLPYSTSAADAALCDANPKAANLNFVLKDPEGHSFNLASLKGNVVLLDFWATWCPPCKVEIPWFEEFQTKYGARGLRVIGVSADDPPAKLKPFIADYKMNYPVLIGDGRDDVKSPKAYGVAWGLPKTFVIGRDGRICKTHLGLSAKERFELEIKSLL